MPVSIDCGRPTFTFTTWPSELVGALGWINMHEEEKIISISDDDDATTIAASKAAASHIDNEHLYLLFPKVQKHTQTNYAN